MTPKLIRLQNCGDLGISAPKSHGVSLSARVSRHRNDEAAMGAFMADQEWAEIKKATAEAHGKFVGDIEDRTLELTD